MIKYFANAVVLHKGYRILSRCQDYLRDSDIPSVAYICSGEGYIWGVIPFGWSMVLHHFMSPFPRVLKWSERVESYLSKIGQKTKPSLQGIEHASGGNSNAWQSMKRYSNWPQSRSACSQIVKKSARRNSYILNVGVVAQCTASRSDAPGMIPECSH